MISNSARMMLRHERKLWRSGVYTIAGVDEAGRGPLAGPVVAAAVVVRPGVFIEGVTDSKALPPARRSELYERIMAECPAAGVGIVDQETIDRVNILNATFEAMHRAVEALPLRPDHLLIDGNRFVPREAGPGDPCPYTTIVGGDALSFSIAAASIIAKVTRDRIMEALDGQFPEYGFARNKGYATREHREAIMRVGLSPIHRRSFTIHSQLEMF